MTSFEIASLATSVIIGLGQIGIVWYGIRALTRSSDARATETARLAKEQGQRHSETMTAFRALIARSAGAEPAR